MTPRQGETGSAPAQAERTGDTHRQRQAGLLRLERMNTEIKRLEHTLRAIAHEETVGRANAPELLDSARLRLAGARTLVARARQTAIDGHARSRDPNDRR